MITSPTPSALTPWAGQSSQRAPVWMSMALPIPKAETCGDWRRVARKGSTSSHLPCWLPHEHLPAQITAAHITSCLDHQLVSICQGSSSALKGTALVARDAWVTVGEPSPMSLHRHQQRGGQISQPTHGHSLETLNTLCILSLGQPNLRQFSQGCEHQETNRHS